MNAIARTLMRAPIAKPTARRTLHATPTKPNPPTIPSAAFEPDAGNYLTGASTIGFGDALFLLTASCAALWVGKKVTEEVKDVVWPEVRWAAKKVEEGTKGEK